MIIVSVLATLALAALAIAKGKVVLGLTDVLFPLLFGLIAAIRLAKPDSPWARRRYPPDGKKMARPSGAARAHRPLPALPGSRGRCAGATGYLVESTPEVQLTVTVEGT